MGCGRLWPYVGYPPFPLRQWSNPAVGVPAFALFSARETGRGSVVLISFHTLHLCFPCLALVRSLVMVEVGRRILLRILSRDHLTRCPAHLFVVVLS